MKNTASFNSSYLVAALLILVGSIGFSAKAVMVKLAYRYGIDSISLLALRMLFSLPFFLVIAYWSNRRMTQTYVLNKRDGAYILLFGLMGYYLASLFDFIGLQYITASLERLVLFIYPTLVVILSAIFLKQKIYTRQYLALLLTYIGIGMAFFDKGNVNEESQIWLGAFWVFMSALSYAIHLIGSGNLLPRVGTLRYTSLVMMIACIAVLLHNAVVNQLQLFDFAPQVYVLGIMMAVFSTVLPSFLFMQGIKIIGSSNASIIGSIGPISTVALAYLFLDERLGWLQWGGTFLVIVGVLMISLQRRKAHKIV
ncbi:MAG: DMT family transporter [Chitinophagales bacterium]